MEKKSLSILTLIIIFTAFAGCSINRQKNLLYETPPPERALEFILETPILAPTPTATTSIENKIQYDYIGSLNIIKKFTIANLYVDQWNNSFPFNCEEKIYEHGLGMWIPSKFITNGEEKDTVIYALNGLYSKIQFDLFTDTYGAYGKVDEYGSYQIKIYADNQIIYDSKTIYFDAIIKDIQITLPDNTNELTIELLQTRGESGTLDTVLGDFRLYYTDTYAATLSSNHTLAPDNTPYSND